MRNYYKQLIESGSGQTAAAPAAAPPSAEPKAQALAPQ
jgi:hypothetical protein